MKTRAERHGDHYLLNGQKIYITWGDHDAADNIIHLVLARLPDAPAPRATGAGTPVTISPPRHPPRRDQERDSA